MTTKIILDCDPGHDDAVALLVAARHTELLGVTTVSGNAPLDHTTTNALLVAQLADIDVEVHAGADRPLLVEPAHAGHIHGETGLNGPKHPEVVRQPSGRYGVEFIIDTVRSVDDVWLVPIGPMTNIALALQSAPDIVDRVAGISVMGGSATVGNVTPVSEFNFWADPHAAAQVFASGISPIRMAGLNLTHQFYVDQALVELLRRGPHGPHDTANTVATFVADLFEFYLATNQQQTGNDSAPLHDPCAILAITHPHLLGFEHGHIAVATDDEITRGMSVWDQRPLPENPPNCEIAVDIDRDAAMAVVTDAVSSYR